MELLKKITLHPAFKYALWVIGALCILLVTFAAGIRVGLHKASFSYKWGANYEKNFMGSGRNEFGRKGTMGQGGPAGMMRGFDGRDFRNAHGSAGFIVSISGSTVVIKDRDGKENTIGVTDKTLIKNGRDDIKLMDLKTGDNIVVMGNPGDNGVINADIIRILTITPNPQN
jgi:hypothetical protein